MTNGTDRFSIYSGQGHGKYKGAFHRIVNATKQRFNSYFFFIYRL